MKICVNEMKNERVSFTTEYGVGRGIWKSKNSPARKDYFVEFDITDKYRYEDISVSNFKQYRMESTENRMRLTMLLLEYDEQGCASFRFGDSIVELETYYDERFLALVNSYLDIYVGNLYLYDEFE